MTQAQAITAYQTIQRMGSKVSGRTAFSLFKLKQRLKPIFDFQHEEEAKLIEKYKAEVNEKGQILIEDSQKRAEFMKEHIELLEMDCEIEPVEISMDQMPDITMAEIEALDGFINFV